MSPTLLLSFLACGLAALSILLLRLWRRDSQRHAAYRSESEARERDAAARLAAAEARLTAAAEAAGTAGETQRQQEERIRRLTEERMRSEAELAALRASSEAEITALQEKIAEQHAAQKAERETTEERFRAQFRNLATEILGEQSQHFRQTSRESIDLLLKPFRDNITDFRQRVEEIYTTQTSQRGELRAELKRLMELNQHISTEAQNLTQALKGNSKVSLTAFVAYTAAATDEERRRALAAHVASVRQHVAELGRKEYQRRFNSPDFVILFVPNEPAFLAALQSDPAIWSDAYERKVIVSSPTNLFALLKLVADLWKYNDQDKNTKEIAACGLKLYEQLVAFTSSLEGVGTALGKARDAYEDAYKRLCTGNDNIVRVGERLRRTARLQTKRRHSARTLELSGDDAAEALPETDAAPQAGIPQSGADATDTGIAGASETAVPGKSETPAAADPSEASASEAL